MTIESLRTLQSHGYEEVACRIPGTRMFVKNRTTVLCPENSSFGQFIFRRSTERIKFSESDLGRILQENQ